MQDNEMLDLLNKLRNTDIYQYGDMYEVSILVDSEDIDEIEVAYWPTYDHNNVSIVNYVDWYNDNY